MRKKRTREESQDKSETETLLLDLAMQDLVWQYHIHDRSHEGVRSIPADPVGEDEYSTLGVFVSLKRTYTNQKLVQ